MNMEKIKRGLSTTGLKIKKYSPEIYTGIGITTFVGTVALAIHQTFKLNDILEVHHCKIIEIEKEADLDGKEVTKEDGTKGIYEYPEELQRHDVRAVRIKTGLDIVKTYSPVAGLGIVSIACILRGFKIMSNRYLAMVIAYNGLNEAFTAYRSRVVEEQGKIWDRHYMYGTELKEETITTIDPETGKKKKEKVLTEVINGDDIVTADTSVIFDKNNPNWYRDPLLSRSFLTAQMNLANDILNAKGHIFLNEVLDMLGFDPTPTGALVGWVTGKNESDGYVDFGLYDFSKPGVREFVNGDADTVILDFNHDGVIFNLI